MTRLTKDILIDLFVWTMILALVGTGAYSWQKITNWSEATIDSLEPAVALAPMPVSDPVSPPQKTFNYLPDAIVVSPPGSPQNIIRRDLSDIWYGTASWYDFTF